MGAIHRLRLTCQPVEEGSPLEGTVVFHLHPTFPRPRVEVAAENGSASLEIAAYGAFTVGVECDGGRTRLELDLAEHERLPEEFRRS